MNSHAALFSSIVHSTIWREPHAVRIVWITMLAIADRRKGVVEAALPGLADLARVTLEECTAAIGCLLAPDPHSRTPDFEGRRIEIVAGGWRILNHRKYREKMDQDERREYLRVKQQEARDKKVASTRESTFINTRQQPSTRINKSRLPTTDQSKRVACIFRRRLTTPWTEVEVRAYKSAGTLAEVDLSALERYYARNWPPRNEVNHLRHSLLTFLHNIPSEIDRAHAAESHGKNGHTCQWSASTSPAEVEPPGWREWVKGRYPEAKLSTWGALIESVRDEFREQKQA